jgi:hypothetical protein
MTNKEVLAYLALSSSGVSVLFIFLGFYKPVLMLWWEDVQNRKKVLKYYGTAAVLFYLMYRAILFFW